MIHIRTSPTEGVWQQVLRSVFRPKGKEVTRLWIKLHNVELHNLHPSSDIIRVINQGG
jgi:hypothetical protein